MMHVLRKAIVSRFYERNAGFFLFIFYLMFGIVESSQLVQYHRSLMLAIADSTIFLAMVCLLWALYMVKCVRFIAGLLAQPKYEFLFILPLAGLKRQFIVLTGVMFLMYLPVFIYSMVACVVAIASRHFLTCIVIFFFQFSLLIVSVFSVSRKLNIRHAEKRFTTWRVIRWAGPKPLPFFYLEQLRDQFKMAMVVTKLFAFLAIVGFLQIPLDHYEIRIALMGILFGLMGHAVIVFEFRRFEDQYLFFTRNLPLSMVRRFLALAIVYSLLLTPELLLLVANKIHVTDVLGIWVFSVSFLLFSHGVQYAKPLNMDAHIQRTLWLFLISFMVILWRAYLPETFLLLGTAFFFYQKNYYKYEGAKG